MHHFPLYRVPSRRLLLFGGPAATSCSGAIFVCPFLVSPCDSSLLATSVDHTSPSTRSIPRESKVPIPHGTRSYLFQIHGILPYLFLTSNHHSNSFPHSLGSPNLHLAHPTCVTRVPTRAYYHSSLSAAHASTTRT